jgi:hypothetical protein
MAALTQPKAPKAEYIGANQTVQYARGFGVTLDLNS